MRSYTTIVSFNEYPITANIAERTLKSNSIWKREKNPKVIITSWIKAIIAPTPKSNSNLKCCFEVLLYSG